MTICRNGHRYETERCNPCRRDSEQRKRREAGIGERLGIRYMVPVGDTEWMMMAECLGHDPEMWFPGDNGWQAVATAAKAKAICARCPVQVECLELAIKCGETHGIWGGVSAHDLPRPPSSRRCVCGRFLPKGKPSCGECDT